MAPEVRISFFSQITIFRDIMLKPASVSAAIHSTISLFPYVPSKSTMTHFSTEGYRKTSRAVANSPPPPIRTVLGPRPLLWAKFKRAGCTKLSWYANSSNCVLCVFPSVTRVFPKYVWMTSICWNSECVEWYILFKVISKESPGACSSRKTKPALNNDRFQRGVAF